VAQLELDIALALRAFSLDVALTVGQETVALVGPSGAGKTTVLRAVAGLRRPGRGRIALDGAPWFDAAAGLDLAPEDRSVGLVFQEYALFPHMSVRRNVAFGGTARVDELLDRFHIAHLAEERPTAISGGERQRVALARALAREPGVLLLDEPLSALDAHTRALVRAELQDLLAEITLPTLLVTHDFRDASALADRIGVIVAGTLRQIAPADELVRRPADVFVARLTGANVLAGTADDGRVTLEESEAVVRVAGRAAGRVGVVVYPWELELARAPAGADGVVAIPGVVTGLMPEGDRVRVRLGDLTVEATRAQVEELELRRGVVAYALLAAEQARVVSLDVRSPRSV
jgi:molybdate transport system ATP-binding protein